MKVQQINQQQNYNKNNNRQTFTGAADTAVQLLRFLDTNQAWGATAVDFSCMVAPRTLTDFTRGPAAGVETLRREASGTVNHAAVGLVYGPLAGMLLAAAVNSKYGIKAQNIYADSDAVDILSKFRYDVLKSDSSDNAIDYAKRVASSISSGDGKKFLSEDAGEKFARTLAKEIKSPDKANKAMLKNIVLSDLGEEANILLKSGEKDKSAGFMALKTGVAAAFGTMVYGLITKFNPKNFLPNIQYKGITPTLNQFKLVYGLTIMSRFLAARDKDELREATVKDTLGYLSWLVFGNFVARGTLKALDKNLIGKTRDEVLYGALKKAGISTVKDGKALPFKELLKLLPKTDKAARKSLRYLNIAQLAGYAFSGIVLGVGIPKLNIYMTKKSEQKRAQLRAMNPANNMLKPENIAFLSSQMSITSNKLLGKD